MNGTNLFRLVITILLTLWAATELMPPTSTPFEEYLVKQVSETISPSGDVITSREENLADFSELVDRANEKVVEAGGQYLAGRPTSPNSFYEAKYKSPTGLVFDLTHKGWAGAVKDVVPKA